MADPTTVIAAGTVLAGRLAGAEDVAVYGRVAGTIALAGVLFVDAAGRVDADCAVNALELHGTLVGDLQAQDRIEVHATARVQGNLTAPSVVVHPGARVRGVVDSTGGLDPEQLRVRASAAAPATPTASPASARGTSVAVPASTVGAGRGLPPPAAAGAGLPARSAPVGRPALAGTPARAPEPARAPQPARAPEPARRPEPARAPEPARRPEPTRASEASRPPEPARPAAPARPPEPEPRPAVLEAAVEPALAPALFAPDDDAPPTGAYPVLEAEGSPDDGPELGPIGESKPLVVKKKSGGGKREA